ncbi:hypothetical protein CDAR_307561 [Caerostris darwini]|uniref:Uncharacterized protein n=1 Tax=Caerostris darwini TaxID=1538125 RepID=A0AAV4VGA9_9ARAC|nr:hypothetical protein CDAR_307561 [Caerostris darwini]
MSPTISFFSVIAPGASLFLGESRGRRGRQPDVHWKCGDDSSTEPISTAKAQKREPQQNDIAAEVTVAAMSSKVIQLLIKYGNFLGAVPPELLAQARLQNRRSSNKHAKRMGRKQKGDKQKNLKDGVKMHKHSVTVSSSLWVVIPVDRPRSTSWDDCRGRFWMCGLERDSFISVNSPFVSESELC